MTGSAVVTTRLSSVVMKSATEVIAKVQIVVLRVFIVASFIGSYYSLTWAQKKMRLLLLQARLQEPLGPGRRVVEQIHRCEDVQQHPEGEEVSDALRIGARDALDVVDERTETLAHDLAHLLVVGVGVGLHLRAQARPVLEQPAVGLADRLQRLLAALAGRGLLEDLERLPQAAAHALEVELLLRAEQAEEIRLGDTGLARDLVGRRAVKPVLAELLHRDNENL